MVAVSNNLKKAWLFLLPSQITAFTITDDWLMVSVVSLICSQRNDKFNFAMGNTFEINVVSPNMQDIITPNAVFARDWGSSVALLNKVPHDITTFFYINFILHYYKLFLVIFNGNENDNFDVILVSVLIDGNWQSILSRLYTLLKVAWTVITLFLERVDMYISSHSGTFQNLNPWKF